MIFALETVGLCLLFWLMCFFGTGTDEKNIKSFSSYPDQVQKLLLKDKEISKKIKVVPKGMSFVSNMILFGIIFLVLGYFIKEENFLKNFLYILIMGQVLNLFDFFVIDLLWWRNSERIRFKSINAETKMYKNPENHKKSFIRAVPMFILTAVIDGIILTLI